jgi:hypothetical protein
LQSELSPELHRLSKKPHQTVETGRRGAAVHKSLCQGHIANFLFSTLQSLYRLFFFFSLSDSVIDMMLKLISHLKGDVVGKIG